METDFTPVTSLFGGALIGAASVLLLLFHGRIAGATGVLTGILFPASRADWSWRAAMIAGMITAPALITVLTRQGPFLAEHFQLPTSNRINARLLGGSALFGVGWGIAGFCPGGVLPALGTSRPEVFLFVGSLILGILLTIFIMKAWRSVTTSTSSDAA